MTLFGLSSHEPCTIQERRRESCCHPHTHAGEHTWSHLVAHLGPRGSFRKSCNSINAARAADFGQGGKGATTDPESTSIYVSFLPLRAVDLGRGSRTQGCLRNCAGATGKGLDTWIPGQGQGTHPPIPGGAALIFPEIGSGSSENSQLSRICASSLSRKKRKAVRQWPLRTMILVCNGHTSQWIPVLPGWTSSAGVVLAEEQQGCLGLVHGKTL